MNFQLPQPDDDFDYYGNSSQDESRGSQGRQFFLIFRLKLNQTNSIFFYSKCTFVLHIIDCVCISIQVEKLVRKLEQERCGLVYAHSLCFLAGCMRRWSCW